MSDSTPDRPVFVIDCDTGIDDALALALMIARRPDDLLAVTTVFGNIPVAQATQNTLDLLSLAGRPDIAVHAGAATSLDGAFRGDDGAPVHGANGLGGVVLPRSSTPASNEWAPLAIARLARENPGRLVIIALGPLTNLAVALTIDPGIAQLIDRVVVMGGALRHPGNATPVAEANIWHDPEAARRVLDELTVSLVPLDATMRQRFTSDHARLLRHAAGRTPRALGEAALHYLDFYEGVFGASEAALHDPLAVAIALGDEEVVGSAQAQIAVELHTGSTRGMTVADLRRHYLGPVQHDTRDRVVLRTADGFGDRLWRALADLP